MTLVGGGADCKVPEPPHPARTTASKRAKHARFFNDVHLLGKLPAGAASMRLFDLMGWGSARPGLCNACNAGPGMATSLKNRKPGRRARTLYPQMACPEPVLP